MADDALQLIEGLGFDRVHWCGHSTGGAMGQVLAIDHPEVSTVAGLFLAEDGVLTVRGERAGRERAEGERMLISETTQGQFVRQFRLPKTAEENYHIDLPIGTVPVLERITGPKWSGLFLAFDYGERRVGV